MRLQRFHYPGVGLVMVALVAFAFGGAAQSNAAVADTHMARALLNSGFKVKAADTAARRAQMRRLPDNQFTMVKQDGNVYYLYADKKDNRLYAGDQYAYRAYEKFVRDNQLRAQGVFVRPLRFENKSDNKTIEVWQGWEPFPAWKSAD